MSHPAAPVIRLPTYSVVIPNYNHAHYLESALEGHLTQRMPLREIIVVDDASTNESCALVERVSDKHSHVRLIRFLRNSGVNAAINWGLREACGDYVCVSAADDVVTPSFVAKSLELLSQYPTAGICFSDRAQLLGDSCIVKRLPLFLSDRPCKFLPEALARLLKGNYFSFASNTILYRRDALSAMGGFNEDLRWYADWFADYVMAFCYGACYVPEVLAIYRVSPGSYSARGARQSETQRELIYRILSALAPNPWQDVARSFHSGALMPEMSVRVLMWLLMSPRLAARLIFGSLLSAFVPVMPDWLHQAARRLAGAPTRLAHRSAASRGERQ